MFLHIMSENRLLKNSSHNEGLSMCSFEIVYKYIKKELKD